MDAALGWIGAIVEWIGKFFPRWLIVTATHAGVKFVRGAKVVAIGPGIHFYWPVTTAIELYPTARQTVPTRSQALVTADDKTIAVAGLITYRIHDVEAILARTYDPDNTIEETAMSVIGRVCSRWSWDDLKAGRESGRLDRMLKSEIHAELKRYGATVDRATLIDMAPCRVVKLIQAMGKDG